MNILNKFTVQNLKLNKKRTIVTIIGIVLSTALICGVIGLVSSFQKSFVNMIIDDVGNFHTRFYDVSKDDLKYVQNNVNVKSSFLTNEYGTTYLKESKNVSKPYMTIMEYDESALKNNGINLVEGRLPQNENEIILSEDIIKNARIEYKVGEKVTIDVGKRVLDDGTVVNNKYIQDDNEKLSKEKIIDTVSKTYIIVGIMERPDYSMEGFSANAYTAITYMKEVNEKASISVLYRNPKNYKTFNEEISKLKNETKGYDTYVNKELLRYQGVINSGAMNALIGIAAVVLCIIIASSVFVIRNSFNISVAEKNRQYGMLSSIGATKKQIRNNVIYEGFVIGLIAIPIGILCGVLGIVVLLKIVNYLLEDALRGMQFVYSLPLIPVLISIVISFITIYLSCLIPSIRASKISPIEAIRGNNEIKIKAKKLKTPKYINKIFGIGGVIASKNLKRCKRKYITTVISIVISIVIFVSLSSFIYYGNKVSGVYYTELSFNMMLSDSEDNIETYKKISKLNGVDNYSYYYESSASIDKDKYCTDFGKEMFNTMENKPGMGVMVYNNEYFKQYIKSLGIDESNYDKGAILSDNVMINNTDGGKELKSIYNVEQGDKFDIQLKGTDKKELPILAKTDQNPMGLESTHVNGGMVIISEAYLDSIEEYSLQNLCIQSSNTTQLENTINDLIKEDASYANVRITNYDKLVEMENRMVLVISIFLYGFITVITLIGVTNIFNTITTNMILRSKEFAMLKSIGMAKKEFNKMIRLESILYGLKALLIGLPIGILGSYLVYKSYAESIDIGYVLPIKAIILSVIFVFVIVGLTMKYSLNRINKQNIIDTIRNDNI